MKKKIGYTTLLAVVLVSLALLPGCKPHHGHGKGPTFAFDYISEALDLTKEQESELMEIKEEVMTKMQQHRPEKKQMLLSLKTQLSSEEIDSILIKQMISEHRSMMDGVIEGAVDRLVEFHRGLSPVQRTKLLKKIEKFEKYHCDTP